MKQFLKATVALSKWLDGIAIIALLLIMLITFLDVIFRYLRHPIPGTYDLVSLGGALVVGFSIPMSSLKKSHVAIDILVNKLNKKWKKIFVVVTRLMGIALFALLTFNFISMGLSYAKTGDSTQTLSLPFSPIAFALGICSLMGCIALLSEIVKIVCKEICDE